MGVQEQITRALQDALHPEQLEVVNDSAKHHGHAGDDGSGESHFSIIIVSEKFSGLNRVQRHQMVYSLLQNNLEVLPHALQITARSPAEVNP